MANAYHTDECIFEGEQSRIFRARRLTDDRPVIIKQPRALYPSPEALARFAREFEVTRAAAADGVIEALELLTEGRSVGIVLEDFGAESVATLLDRGRPPVETVLQIAVQVARALAEVHRRDIVHKDLSPGNIVWNGGAGSAGVAKLIDFGMSQVLLREEVPVQPAAGFEGTPAFVSPEQTGRMNRVVDHRSDFYSLGATLYALLTGQPPFVTDDPLALVHAHLAKTPRRPDDMEPTVPVAVADIVMRLLEKRAEDRYQSATGLAADLERCLVELEQVGTVSRFPLREHDVDERLHIPQELYGRADEVGALVRAFEHAAVGPARLLLVSGYSGIGKTSLVQELHRLLPGRGARFVEGKFDQFNRSTPYASLIQALSVLVRVVLTEDVDIVAAWKTRVLNAIGDNGRVLTDVIPEVEHLLGPQPEIDALPPSEARNRFQVVIANFIRAAADEAHPLVLFLDDLQWADLPSIELIARLATDPQSRHLLLIGAYRDNEVDDTHPLAVTLGHMRAAGAPVDTVVLGPLGEEDVLAMVSDTVGDAGGRVRLALVCHAKTGGNAFFLKRFLHGIHDAGLLVYDAEARRWTWDLDAIQAQAITENVVDFLAAEIEVLPTGSRRALEVAACIGDTFDLRTLAVALGCDRKDALADLRAVLSAELASPAEPGFWFVDEVDEATTNFTYRFAHDRIRQAAYALIEPDDAAGVHLRLGRTLAGELGDPDTDPRLFDVVEHLNRVADRLTGPDERDRLCGLDLAAGRRAAASAAFPAAHAFYRHALAALGTDSWATDYERTHAIHVEGARAAYLAGDTATMESLVASATAHARDVIDRVEAQEVGIYALVAAQRFGEAVDSALDALSLLGVHIPREPTSDQVDAAVAGTLALLAEHGADQIDELPLVDDPLVMAAQRIENHVMSPAYLAVPSLLPVLAADIVRSTLEHGVCKASPYGFAIFGLVLNAGNLIDVGYSTGKTATRMLDRFDDRSVRTKTLHVFFNLIKPFTDPLRELLTDQQQVFQLGIDTGDLEYAGWALHSIVANAVYASTPLPALADTATHYLRIIEHHQQLPPYACTVAFAQLIANLRGQADDPARLIGPDYDERSHLAELAAADFRGAAFIVTTAGTYTRYLFGEHAEAVRFADAGGAFADGASSTYHQVWWHQYRTLAVLAQAEVAEDLDPASIAASVEQIRVWSRFSPANHAHRVHLIDAEIARVEGRTGDAADLFDLAIASAQSGGFLNEAALANELCGELHLRRGSETAARAYLLEACFAYDLWGATAKATQVAGRHGSLLHGVLHRGVDGPVPARGFVSTTGRSVSRSETSAELDLATLFKAANLIASETHLDTLLRRILDVAIENAGATRGYLVVDDDGALRVGAARDADARDIAEPGTMITDRDDVPSGLVSYVARTGEPVVIVDVRSDPRWRGASEVAEDRPTSILCAPIVHQEVRSGIVYLDNDLVAGAFTPARIQVLELLSRQAAISIENARYTEELRTHRDHLEELVQARTRELDDALGELRAANAVLDRLSLTDPLTGLPNRRHFDQAFEAAWDAARREASALSVLMVDVDWFKRYNDRYGHQQGDDCLRRIAAALAANVLRPTDLVARYGGEEFAVILSGADLDGARRVGEAMIEAVRELGVPHEAAPDRGQVTISIGAALGVPEHTTPGALLALADRGLYRAKELGRNRFALAE